MAFNFIRKYIAIGRKHSFFKNNTAGSKVRHSLVIGVTQRCERLWKAYSQKLETQAVNGLRLQMSFRVCHSSMATSTQRASTATVLIET